MQDAHVDARRAGAGAVGLLGVADVERPPRLDAEGRERAPEDARVRLRRARRGRVQDEIDRDADAVERLGQ